MINKLYSFFLDNLMLWIVIFMVVVVVGIVCLEGISMRYASDTEKSVVAALESKGFSEISDVRADGFFPCRWRGKTGGHNMFPYTAKGNFHGRIYDNIRICFHSSSTFHLKGSPYISPDEKYWE